MKIIKLGMISAVIFSIILFLLSLLIPSHVRISRAINIDAPKEKIQDKVSHIKAWTQWNELYNDKLEVTMISAQPNLVTTLWRYKEKTIDGSFRFEESGGITVVQWYFDFRLKWYPWQKFGSIILDKQFGPLMEKSLKNLEKLVENSP